MPLYDSKKLVRISALSALAIVFSFIKIPYQEPLSFDLSLIPILIALATLGYIPMLFVTVITALINGFIWPTTFYIGSISMALSSISIASLYLLSQKLSKNYYFTIIFITFFYTFFMLFINFLFVHPIYDGEMFYTGLVESKFNNSITDYIAFIFGFYFYFNVIKSVLILTIYFFVRKIQKYLI